MTELPKPAYRIRPDGSKSSLDSPYEQGMYIGTIGLGSEDNPYPKLEKLAHRLWKKGWAEAVRLTAEYHRNNKS